jgi:hypothetical protein
VTLHLQRTNGDSHLPLQHLGTDFLQEPVQISARPKVSLIIPTLNEGSNLPLVFPFIPMDWVDEILLVDGRSSDETIEIARELIPSIKVILEKKTG